MLYKYYANAMHFNWKKLEKKPNAVQTLCLPCAITIQMICKCYLMLSKSYSNVMQMLWKKIFKCLWKISNDYEKSQMTMENLK